jgi:hypothetical protein
VCRSRRETEACASRLRGCQGFASEGKLLGYLIAQEPTEPRADVRQLFGATRRNRLPAKEVIKEREQCRWGLQLVPGGFDVAYNPNYRIIDQVAILPEAEGITVV